MIHCGLLRLNQENLLLSLHWGFEGELSFICHFIRIIYRLEDSIQLCLLAEVIYIRVFDLHFFNLLWRLNLIPVMIENVPALLEKLLQISKSASLLSWRHVFRLILHI